MKQKTCSRCGKKYGVNSFDGGDVCARCISWEARRQALKRRYIKRYQEVTQLKHKSDVRLQLAALEAIIENGTMAETARQLGVNRGNIHKAINGEDVPVLRRIFGIKQHLVEIEPCPQCGEVHKLKHCNKRRKRRQRVDRMAARLSPEDGARLRSHLKSLGYESVTDYWVYFLSKI
jgi:DNA-binding phage protein